MRTFEGAVATLRDQLREFNIQESQRNEYVMEVLGEQVNVIVLKTSLTGSERPRPQIRVFTDAIIRLANASFRDNKKFFCFIHCSHGQTELKFRHLQPDEYLISLESNWNSAGGRIDVRSIYDVIENAITTAPISYLKINSSQHTTPSVLLATVFKFDDTGLEHLKQYLRFFDSRLISQQNVTAQDEGEPEEDEVEDDEVAGAQLISPAINKIFFGAPGTGKSYSIQAFIRDNGIPEFQEKNGHPNVFRTTMHPEFTYYDFVGQVMPKVKREQDNSVIEYDFVPRVFTRALARAFEVEEREPVFLILEEMSRANVAAVLGDLFQLLDRNVETGESEYLIHNELIAQFVFEDETKPIYLPGNLFIVGTVNTNDQNVFVMDTAFKRRFEFHYVPSNTVVRNEDDGSPINNFEFELEEGGSQLRFNWSTLYRALNKFITNKTDGLALKEDKQLGQFFIKFREADHEYNVKQLTGKLLQYLYEDIESAAYVEGISLFKNDIHSFGDVYLRMSEGNNVFSAQFLREYNNLKD